MNATFVAATISDSETTTVNKIISAHRSDKNYGENKARYSDKNDWRIVVEGILERVAREGLSSKMTFQQRME